MPKRQGKKPNSGFSIGGSVDTGGGDIAGGNIKKGDVYQSHGLDSAEIKELFLPVYQLIERQDALPSEDKEDLKASVEEIQGEVAKGSDADGTFIERRLRNIGRMAPDILDVILKTISNPVLGLATLAQKIAGKAGGEESNKKESVKKNLPG